MKHICQYLKKSNFRQLADYLGVAASGLCFIHCWLLPLVLVMLPGLVRHNEWVHPVLCSIALLSTLPMILNKSFNDQRRFVQFAVIIGNTMMLMIVFNHQHLSVMFEMLLNTIGGICLAYVHYSRLKMNRETN